MNYERAVKTLKAEGLSTRTAGALAYSGGGIRNLRMLRLAFTKPKQLLLVKGIGKKAFAEILVALAEKEMITWYVQANVDQPNTAQGFMYRDTGAPEHGGEFRRGVPGHPDNEMGM